VKNTYTQTHVENMTAYNYSGAYLRRKHNKRMNRRFLSDKSRGTKGQVMVGQWKPVDRRQDKSRHFTESWFIMNATLSSCFIRLDYYRNANVDGVWSTSRSITVSELHGWCVTVGSTNTSLHCFAICTGCECQFQTTLSLPGRS